MRYRLWFAALPCRTFLTGGTLLEGTVVGSNPWPWAADPFLLVLLPVPIGRGPVPRRFLIGAGLFRRWFLITRRCRSLGCGLVVPLPDPPRPSGTGAVRPMACHPWLVVSFRLT